MGYAGTQKSLSQRNFRPPFKTEILTLEIVTRSLVHRRSLLPGCPRELGDVTAHSRVQDWPSRERLGTRLRNL